MLVVKLILLNRNYMEKFKWKCHIFVIYELDLVIWVFYVGKLDIWISLIKLNVILTVIKVIQIKRKK